MNKKLYVSIADHGFGHLSQSSSVIKQLYRLDPSIHLTIQCGYDKNELNNWLNVPYQHIQHRSEFGMLMDNAVDVQQQASLRRYRDFHQQWNQHLQQEIQHLEQAKPDLVFTNVSYLTLAAAQQLGIKNIAMCSLNWSEILNGYAEPEDQALCQQIDQIYQQADLFIQPSPHMSMPSLSNRQSIDPIARLGRSQKAALKQQLNIPSDSQLLLVGLGGIPTSLPLEEWPVEEGIYYLIPDSWPKSHVNAYHFKQANMAFIDLLSSCDVLITKPGYGSFSEAACNDIPLIYLRRKDWPEEPYLIEWLKQYGRCIELSREGFYAGSFNQALQLIPSHSIQQTEPSGAQQAAEILLNALQ